MEDLEPGHRVRPDLSRRTSPANHTCGGRGVGRQQVRAPVLGDPGVGRHEGRVVGQQQVRVAGGGVGEGPCWPWTAPSCTRVSSRPSLGVSSRPDHHPLASGLHHQAYEAREQALAVLPRRVVVPHRHHQGHVGGLARRLGQQLRTDRGPPCRRRRCPTRSRSRRWPAPSPGASVQRAGAERIAHVAHCARCVGLAGLRGLIVVEVVVEAAVDVEACELDVGAAVVGEGPAAAPPPPAGAAVVALGAEPLPRPGPGGLLSDEPPPPRKPPPSC